ncbi:glycosyltransferase [Amycolatopsis sp. H20-H5]|uniref:glycosyltransferase n=1 Tax=Amycolatopsis sp. H20-H5 TaxID=3046309 RepID=UPI002DBE8E6D|nr:glycosyltransferase [Amycolatopsis sp. H20-H5]MEC3982695.1 glycosyltransferase [Amycolatopsis sp. H20-H5]
MRLIFTSLASHGHLYPLLPLAVAARDAGHHVLFATAEDYLPIVRKAGLEAAPAGIGISAAFAERPGADGRTRAELSPAELIPLAASIFGEMLPRRFVAGLGPLIERERPDLVIYEFANPGGGLAAALAGVPAVCHGFGKVNSGGLAALMGESLAAYSAELGFAVPPLDVPFVDICPESVQSAEFMQNPKRVPLRPVGWNEPGDLPRGLGRPLVYLTLGTAMGDVPVLKAAIDGLAGLDVQVLVATGPTVEVSALGEVPENVRLEAWVPQADLLPQVDLVVHHGGSGTTLGAFGAGLPQLVLPQGADQFTNAEAVFEAGVGDRLLGEAVTGEAVREYARRLLVDETVRGAAGRLAAEVAGMPSPGEVVELLPGFA